jgi:CBS domain-containing protein
MNGAHSTMDDPGFGDRPKSLMDVFHRLNSVIPEEQEVLKITPETRATDALAVMHEHSFSQLPVVQGAEVLGVFSYRSYARGVAKLLSEGEKVVDMQVEEFIESVKFARVTDEFETITDQLDKDDVVMAGDPDRLQGVVTAIDVLRYLHHVAGPFVLIKEMELALRELIRLAVDDEQLRECVRNCSENKSDDHRTLSDLTKMTFNDYVQIIGDGRNWAHFRPLLSGDRGRTRAKLVRIRDLRNDVFHFRRQLTVEDYDALVMHRDWMLRKAREADAKAREAKEDE